MLTNSSVQAWLNFDGTLPAALPVCQTVTHPDITTSRPDLTTTNCSIVCPNSTALFNPYTPQNLVTCGLWATVVNPYFSSIEYRDTSFQAEVPNVSASLKPFQSVGLGASSPQQYTATVEAISLCLSAFDSYSRIGIMGDDEITISNCTRWSLFPIASNTENSYKHSIKSLRNCITDICAAPTFNPDLGGIGVFTSLIMQVGIILIAFLALLLLEKLPRLSKKTRELHIEVLVTAMVEFHKYQCYFASSVQIATLVVFANLQTYDVDTRLLGLLALNGIVPIIFTLACIAQHGRQSWYLIILSVLTLLLSTATMVINIDNYYHPKSSITGDFNDFQPYLEYVCQSDIVNLCGKPRDAIYGVYGLNLPLTFSAVWLYSSTWAVTYVLKKKLENPRSAKWRKYFPLVWIMRLLVPRSYILDVVHKLWEILVLCLWAFCFAFQLYICKLYVNESLISTTWSFGQIVAVMIWIPSIVEFIYIEIGTVQLLLFASLH